MRGGHSSPSKAEAYDDITIKQQIKLYFIKGWKK